MKKKLLKKLTEIMESKHLIDDLDVVTVESNFADDLDIDSLDKVEFVMEVEKQFKICVPDEKLDSMTKVGECIDYLTENHNSEVLTVLNTHK